MIDEEKLLKFIRTTDTISLDTRVGVFTLMLLYDIAKSLQVIAHSLKEKV